MTCIAADGDDQVLVQLPAPQLHVAPLRQRVVARVLGEHQVLVPDLAGPLPDRALVAYEEVPVGLRFVLARFQNSTSRVSSQCECCKLFLLKIKF